ncbi:hypothetical protein AAC387_Pa08g1210 [Persea americana]
MMSTIGERIHVQLKRENDELKKQADTARRLLKSMENEKREMVLRLESRVASQQAHVLAQVQAELKCLLRCKLS